MRYLRRHRPAYWNNPYWSNPDSWEASVRLLLKKLTGAGWKIGQPPPAEWHLSYVPEHPEWTALWLVAAALETTPEELLAKIRPGRRRLRDVDELSILYEFIKDNLVLKGQIRGRDVSDLASSLGLATLSGPNPDAAKERSYLLKQLVYDGYATQHMGRFKGSSYYVPTEKLLAERPARPTAPQPEAVIPVAQVEAAMPIPFYTEEPPEMPTPAPVIQPAVIPEPIPVIESAPKPAKSQKKLAKGLPARKIVIIGGQKGSCPKGEPSLRAIKQKECAWLDQNFRWSVLSSYRNDNFKPEHLPKEVDLAIIFSKYMNHSQIEMAIDFYSKQGIPFIKNLHGNALGSLQMAAEAAKTHGPKWFADAYAGYMEQKRKGRKPRRLRRWR